MALSKRICHLREQAMQRGGSRPSRPLNPYLRDVALWRASVPTRSRVQVRAAFVLDTVRLAPVEIGAEWGLAGEHILLMPGSRGQEMLGFGRPRPDSADLARHLGELGASEADLPAMAAALQQWERPTAQAVGERPADADGGRGSWNDGNPETVFWAGGWIENHSIRDFAKVLRLGFAGIAREIEAHARQADVADPDYARRHNFWQAARHICEAGVLLGRNYAEAARRLAAAAGSEAERQRLLAMAERCDRVPAEGARTLHEAVQALWLAHVLTCGEDGINANSIGRLDQILQPYYAADLVAGRTSRAEALELMEELACKLYLDYDVQAITLGGVDAEGVDAVNEMSYIILEATRHVDFIRDLSVRIHPRTPEPFLEQACAMVARGGGIPFFFNDTCFVPALHERGIALADARDYAPIGCIELTVPGRANPHAVSGWFNSTKCLELALFNGIEPRTGRQLGPATGELAEFANFEAFWQAYAAQVECFARRMVCGCNYGELLQREWGPLPCWSTLTDDCIARGRDITDGGAVYNYHSICLLGTANTADSMMALRQLLFDGGTVAPAELLAALRANFEGHEALRRRLQGEVAKYGNDCPEVDDLARRVDDHFIDLMDGMHSPLGGRYFVHLFSFLCNIAFGKTVGATPDGRRAAEPLAYSLSAHQGRDAKGVTAMLKSLSRLPHHRAAGASAAIVEVDPKVVAGEGGQRRLVQLVKTAMGMGVGQLQWNVVTAERLREAQEDPERCGNIAVRVAGYSQMFRLLDRELQDHVIARTKHRG